MKKIKKWLIPLLSLLTSCTMAGDSRLLTPIPDRPLAPNFTLKDVNGNTHQLVDYRGKVVVVNFWATWCPPCVHEMPSMQQAWDALRNDQVVILAINHGEELPKVQAFHRQMSLTFPLLLDLRMQLMAEWNARGMPTTFVVDPKGRLVYQAVGGRDWNNPTILQTLRNLSKPLATAANS